MRRPPKGSALAWLLLGLGVGYVAAVEEAANGVRTTKGSAQLQLTRAQVSSKAQEQRKRPKHLLTDQDLSGITSIDCLEDVQRFDRRRQKAPIHCGSLNQSAPVANETSTAHDDGWYVGHYPKYTEKICDSNGTRFCDPDGILDKKERHKVWKRLSKFWVENSVHSCPLPGSDRPESYPFNLGIVLMQSFPAMELDDESLDHFGSQVMSSWDMAQDRSCPNGALLIFIKDYQKAFLSGLSCEFVCKKRPGGQNVMSAMQTQMDEDDVFKAVMDGIAMFESVLQSVDPESVAHAKAKSQDDMNVSPELASDINSLEGELEELTGGKAADHEEGASKEANEEFSGKMSHEEWRRMKSLELYFARREGTYVLFFRFIVGLMLLLTVGGCCCVARYSLERDFHQAYTTFHKDLDPTYNDPSMTWDNYGAAHRGGYGSV